jgi:hypothetical protein
MSRRSREIKARFATLGKLIITIPLSMFVGVAGGVVIAFLVKVYFPEIGKTPWICIFVSSVLLVAIFFCNRYVRWLRKSKFFRTLEKISNG